MSVPPRVCATIEARMTSSRLPGKILMEAAGKTMLEHMVERLKRVPQLEDIIIATTTNTQDDPVVKLAQRLQVRWHRGSEHDVLQRVLEAAQKHEVDIIVETTGDCPLIDPEIVSKTIETFLSSSVDYVSNTLEPRTFPVGMDVQVFATRILDNVAGRTYDPDDREHVSLFIYSNPHIYTLKSVKAPSRHHAPHVRLTLDTSEDLKLIRQVFEALYPDNPDFDLADILDFLLNNRASNVGG